MISCFNYFVQKRFPRSVNHFDVSATGASMGQNHKHRMVQFVFTFPHLNRVQSIDFHLPTRGHSFLPCHRAFRLIATMKRKRHRENVHGMA